MLPFTVDDGALVVDGEKVVLLPDVGRTGSGKLSTVGSSCASSLPSGPVDRFLEEDKSIPGRALILGFAFVNSGLE
jgi:hypothetical protein